MLKCYTTNKEIKVRTNTGTSQQHKRDSIMTDKVIVDEELVKQTFLQETGGKNDLQILTYYFYPFHS